MTSRQPPAGEGANSCEAARFREIRKRGQSLVNVPFRTPEGDIFFGLHKVDTEVVHEHRNRGSTDRA